MATYDVGGRAAIVTGAGSGIGRAVARLLAANGAAVLVTDINELGAKTVVDEIRAAGGTAASLVGDVADHAFAERSVAAASELGPLRMPSSTACACRLPRLRRRLVHHRQLSPGGRRLHRTVTAPVTR